MLPHDKLDAFKVCRELTIGIYPTIEVLRERDPEMAAQLWQAALTTGSRIARGAVFPNRRVFVFCLNRSLGALQEIGYHLSLADGLGILDQETCRRLEELRGRANFYVLKLLSSLLEPPRSA